MFGGKNIPAVEARERKISTVTRQLQDISFQPQNPFREFVKFDGNVRILANCISKFSLHHLQMVTFRLKLVYQ